ncbi:MAG: FecR family protein [Sphingobacteriales bacterium]
MSEQVPTYLVDKYLKGQCTPDEEALVEDWYNSFQNDADYLSFVSIEERNELKNRIRNRIENNITSVRDIKSKKRKALTYLVYALPGVAASLIVCFILMRPAKHHANGAKLITVTNNTKNIFEQVLSDGSHIWMMPGAKIKYAQVFTGNQRVITLSGESFFEVTKNPLKPFIVYSGNLITKVWGTSFRIRDSRELSYADVTVLTGKVSVKLLHPDISHNLSKVKNIDEVMIYPNQQVSFAKKQHLFKEQLKPQMQGLSIWKKESLSFDNMPVKDVIPVLNKAFNISISTADQKISNYLLSADFNGLNFPEIMELIHKALNVNYEINSKAVIIKETNN